MGYRGVSEDRKISKKELALIMKLAALNDDLKRKEYRLLLYLLPELRKGRPTTIFQAEIARQLAMSPSQVSKAMAKLYKAHILSFDDTKASWKRDASFHEDILEELDDIEEKIDRIIAINVGASLDDDDDDEYDDDDE